MGEEIELCGVAFLAAVSARRKTHEPLKDPAEGNLGLVSHAAGDFRQRGVRGPQQPSCFYGAPLRQILERRLADEFVKPS